MTSYFFSALLRQCVAFLNICLSLLKMPSKQRFFSRKISLLQQCWLNIHNFVFPTLHFVHYWFGISYVFYVNPLNLSWIQNWASDNILRGISFRKVIYMFF